MESWRFKQAMRDIESAVKGIKRGGNLLKTLIHDAITKHNKYAPGSLAMDLCNTYGLTTRGVVTLLESHGVKVDAEEFAALIDAQESSISNAHPC